MDNVDICDVVVGGRQAKIRGREIIHLCASVFLVLLSSKRILVAMPTTY